MNNLSGKPKKNVSSREISNRPITSGASNTSNITVLEKFVNGINFNHEGQWTPTEPEDSERTSARTAGKCCCCCCPQCRGKPQDSSLRQTQMENKETQTLISAKSEHDFQIEEIFERFLISQLENSIFKSNIRKPYTLLKDLRCIDNSSIEKTIEKKSSFNSLKGDTGNDDKLTNLMYFLIKRFQWLEPINIHAYPVKDFSRNLEEFVNRELRAVRSSRSPISSQLASELHSMNMEIIRVATFSSFPRASSVSTIRLAKEGFYYTGKEDTVVCFACGQQRHGWEPADNPREIHQQISPNCPFLNSEQSKNVPIGQNETVGNMQVRENERRQGIVNRQPEALQNFRQAPNAEVVSSSSHERNMEQNGNSEKQDIKTTHQKALERQKKINKFMKSLDPLGINFDRPKYPSYAVMATRVSSFKDWPSSVMQTPRDLAMAGFIYAGYGDYTRCFFCGGGLRNWEPQDEPWREHARWFPKCAFLRQNKGDEYVAMIHIEHEEEEEQLALESAEKPSSSYANCASALPGATESKDEALAEIFDLSSVQSVLQMGYSLEEVKAAFEFLKLAKDVGEISGEDIMNVILSNEENTAASETTCTTHNTNRQTVRLEIPAPSDQSDRYTERMSGLASLKPIPDPTALMEASHDRQSLIEEYRELRNLRVCKICLENDASIAMLPCGHLCCCTDCAPAMRNCPICGQFVKGTVRTWLA
ncbi:baculoviral IAP repeat-containing protein 3-like [Saccostrea cucullata]|uniref:baculoviral IAP repeat-containing protein 3-like n=1 Tax=Saccostrea cuccullata TaxID=36930 RepID=UPI002ED1EE7E